MKKLDIKTAERIYMVGLGGILGLLMVGLLLLLLAPAMVQPVIETGSQAATSFTDLAVTNDVTVGNDLTVAGAATAGTLNCTTATFTDFSAATITATTGFIGDLTGDVTGDITGTVVGNVTGDLTGALTLGADDFATLTPGTSITVTNGAAFTPTATYQPIVAAAAVTPTITAGATAGRVLLLTNTGTDVINLADSGTLKLTAAAALGQYDTLLLISDGTNWLELSRADN